LLRNQQTAPAAGLRIIPSVQVNSDGAIKVRAVKDEIINPSYEYRILNHWDNPNGSIERGYAGKSIFWHSDSSVVVTDRDKTLWREYARANASIGINGSVLNNVNASQ